MRLKSDKGFIIYVNDGNNFFTYRQYRGRIDNMSAEIARIDAMVEEQKRETRARYSARLARERIDSFYGDCYNARISDIIDAYNESRACDIWD